MPGFDGTGPRGQGPLTGGGRGYCAIAFPPPATGRLPYGYAGWQGTPVHYAPLLPARWPRVGMPWGFPMARWWPRRGCRGGRAWRARWW